MVLVAERVELELERVVGGAERGEVAFELFGFEPGTAVLEPDGDLAGLEGEVERETEFAVGVELVVKVEALFESVELGWGKTAFFV